MGHIFISYSHKDKEYVHKLQENLQSEGFEVWIDDRVDFGDEWPMVIQEHLDTCTAFILVASENAYSSKWVQKEVTRAQRINKPFFPILLSGDPWLSIESTQYADLRDGKLPTEEFYQQLEKFAERESTLDVYSRFVEEWPAIQNRKYKFALRYPEDGTITLNEDEHIKIDFPIPEGTNLREKYLIIVSRVGDNCSSPFEKEGMVKRKVVKINNAKFLCENGGDAAAGTYREWISYSTSRENICISISFVMLLASHYPYFPKLLPRIDLEAEKETVLFVVSSLTWLEA